MTRLFMEQLLVCSGLLIIIDSSGFFLHYYLILMNSNIQHLKYVDFNTLKKLHVKGTNTQTDRQTDRQTSRLLDQIGPVGRFIENQISYCQQIYINIYTFKQLVLYRHLGFFCTLQQFFFNVKLK